MVEFFVKNSYQIIFNVIGGLIAVGIVDFSRFLYKKYQNKKFKGIFGQDVARSDNFHIVYAQFVLTDAYDEKGELRSHPYRKPDQHGVGFSIDRPVSSCEVRAAKYLSTAIGLQTSSSPVLSSDYDLRGRLDISFVSLGGPYSNYKTEDVNSNEGNTLIKFDQKNNQFIDIETSQVITNREGGFDYGLILKIHPTQFPNRTWILCAGIGEWGTSGAAWYLAYKWKEIYAYAKSSPFAIILKVKQNQDESTEPIFKLEKRKKK